MLMASMLDVNTVHESNGSLITKDNHNINAATLPINNMFDSSRRWPTINNPKSWPNQTKNQSLLSSHFHKKTQNNKNTTENIQAATVNQDSKKYGSRPHVIQGRLLNEPIDKYSQCPINTQHMLNILQKKVNIQPMDYCKTVDVKIALDRDENGEVSHLTPKEMLLLLSLLKFYSKFRNLYIFTKIVNGDAPISLRLIEYFVVNYVVDHDTVYNIVHYQSNPSYLIQLLNPPPTPSKRTSSQHSKHTPPPPITSPLDLLPSDTTDKNIIEHNATNINISTETQIPKQRYIMGNELDLMMDFDNYILAHDKYKAQLKEYSKLSFDPFCRSTRVCRGSNVSRNSRISLVLPGGVTLSTTVAQMNFFKWAINDHILEYILDNQSIIDKAMSEYENSKNISDTQISDPLPLLEANDIELTDNNIISTPTSILITHTPTSTPTSTPPSTPPSTINTNIPNILSNNSPINPITSTTKNDINNIPIYSKVPANNSANIVISDNISGNVPNIISLGNSTHTKKASDINDDSSAIPAKGRRRRRGRESKQSVTRYTCRRIVTFD